MMVGAPPGRIGRVRHRVTPRSAAIVAGAISAVLFVLFALIVPPGLPYDEPSHFGTVEFYGDERALPVMGDPGVTYEAQMGPVYYTLAGAMNEVADAAIDRESAFYLVRLAGLVAWALTLGCVFVVVRRLSGDWPAAAAVALVGLNPALLAVVSSVQNDGLAILLGTVALVVIVSAVDTGDLPVRTAVAYGLISGVAVLTKVHVGLLVAAGLVAMLRAAARDRVRNAAIVAGTVAAITGWWFLRNLDLYGDVTGRAGVERTGVTFPATAFSPSGIWSFARGTFGYLWTPAEYYRNVIDTPRVFEAVAIVLSAVALVGLSRRRGSSPAGIAVTAIAMVFVAAYAIACFTTSSLGGRLLYPLVAIYAAALVRGYSAWGSRVAVVLVGATLFTYVALAAVMLRDVGSLPSLVTDIDLR